MKIKTEDLVGPALDWAVAKCEFVGTPPVNYYGGSCWTAEGNEVEVPEELTCSPMPKND